MTVPVVPAPGLTSDKGSVMASHSLQVLMNSAGKALLSFFSYFIDDDFRLGDEHPQVSPLAPPAGPGTQLTAGAAAQ